MVEDKLWGDHVDPAILWGEDLRRNAFRSITKGEQINGHFDGEVHPVKCPFDTITVHRKELVAYFLRRGVFP